MNNKKTLFSGGTDEREKERFVCFQRDDLIGFVLPLTKDESTFKPSFMISSGGNDE